MIYFSIFLSLLAISLCIFILFKFETLKKEKLKKEIKDNYVVMPKLKEMPYYQDVDPDNKTLYDVIHSMNIEDWKLEHYNDSNSIGDFVYEFHFSNPQNTLKVTSRMRYYSDFGGSNFSNDLVLIGFHVGTVKGTISYKESETNRHLSVLIRQYLWKIVCEKNQALYNDQFSHYLSVKESIDKELKTLRRNETLTNILNNE
jgi:hypothetical protein